MADEKQQLPRFRSHKVVEGMKISEVVAKESGGAVLYGELASEIHVAPSYVEKHAPQVGGYYVRYEDGYESWSPAEAFEGGYTPVDAAPTTKDGCGRRVINLVPGGEPREVLVPTPYPVTEDTLRRFDGTFTYHAPKPGQPERYTYLREAAKALALDFVAMTPPSREQSLALTKLEEAVFWANAAIARGEA